MRNRIIASSLTVGIAIIACAYWTGRIRESQASDLRGANKVPAAAALRSSQDGYAGLVDTLARIEGRLALLELRQAASAAEPPVAEAPASKQSTKLDFQSESELQMDREIAINAAIDERFRTEPRDRNWASTTEGSLQNALKAAVDDGAHYRISTLKCLTSLCEMVLAAATPEQLRGAMYELSPRISGMSSFSLTQPTQGPDGSSSVTLRLFREGYPQPGQQ